MATSCSPCLLITASLGEFSQTDGRNCFLLKTIFLILASNLKIISSDRAELLKAAVAEYDKATDPH